MRRWGAGLVRGRLREGVGGSGRAAVWVRLRLVGVRSGVGGRWWGWSGLKVVAILCGVMGSFDAEGGACWAVAGAFWVRSGSELVVFTCVGGRGSGDGIRTSPEVAAGSGGAEGLLVCGWGVGSLTKTCARRWASVLGGMGCEGMVCGFGACEGGAVR